LPARAAVRLLQIDRRRPRQARIVAVKAVPGIAAAAKQAAHLAGLVVMIDAEPPLAGLALADPAHTALPPQHRLVVRKRDPVFGLEMILAVALAGPGSHLFPIIGVGFASFAPGGTKAVIFIE
jgi:hypothetical protein